MGHDVDLGWGTDPDDGRLDDEELAPIDPTRLVVTGSPLHLDVPPWMAEAACRGMDEKVFFPTRDEGVYAAKAVCRGCVVREDCLEYALANDEKHGVWGGMSERERRVLRRERSRR